MPMTPCLRLLRWTSRFAGFGSVPRWALGRWRAVVGLMVGSGRAVWGLLGLAWGGRGPWLGLVGFRLVGAEGGLRGCEGAARAGPFRPVPNGARSVGAGGA